MNSEHKRLSYTQVQEQIRDSLYWETLNDLTVFNNSYRYIEEEIYGSITFFMETSTYFFTRPESLN